MSRCCEQHRLIFLFSCDSAVVPTLDIYSLLPVQAFSFLWASSATVTFSQQEELAHASLTPPAVAEQYQAWSGLRFESMEINIPTSPPVPHQDRIERSSAHIQ